MSLDARKPVFRDIVIVSVRPICYLLLNNCTKPDQIWCVSYSHEWGVQHHNFFGPPLGAVRSGQKFKYDIRPSVRYAIFS